MSEIETNKDLKDSLNKCRCCLRLIIDDRKAVDIDEKIQEQFFNLCSITLYKVDILATRICQLCANDLHTFSSLRDDLIEKQNTLYSLAGFKITALIENEKKTISTTEELPPESKPEQADYDIVEEEEYIWLDADEENVEEIQENEENSMTYCNADDEETANAVLKIEKIEYDNVIHDQPNKRSRSEIDSVDEMFIPVYDENNDTLLTEDLVTCDLCGIDVLESQFDQHTELMHFELIKCEKCGDDFKSKILLKKHDAEVHSLVIAKSGQKIKRKVHFCGHCDKDYEYKKHLDDHIRSFHKKERNRECPICHRFFYHRDIKKHIEHVHGERNIVCGICNKRYSCQENLKLHMRYHEAPKYVCEFDGCGKKFRQKILYEHHKIKHSSEKTIECSQCENSFYTTRDLKRHILRVHTKVLRKCFGCAASFHRKDKYREHIIKQHRELTVDEQETLLENLRNMKWNEEA